MSNFSKPNTGGRGGQDKSGKVKLSAAQAKLLADLPTTCAENYEPARKLVELGLARWQRGRFADILERVETPALPTGEPE